MIHNYALTVEIPKVTQSQGLVGLAAATILTIAGCSFDTSGFASESGKGSGSDASGDPPATSTGTPDPTTPTTSTQGSISSASNSDATTTITTNPDPTTTTTTTPVDPTTTEPDPTTTEPDPSETPATCGDGVIDDGEDCDDGPDNGDTCSSQCKTPTCGDAEQNQGESDVDCGGANCDPCLPGAMCTEQDDCVEVCGDGTCRPPVDCQELKLLKPMAPNGTYRIAPTDGDPFEVYCIQDVEGGGWTLLLKADGRQNTFAYTADIWTSTELFLTSQPNLRYNQTKLNTWNTVPVKRFLIAMHAPITAEPGDTLMFSDLQFHSFTMTGNAITAHALFQPSNQVLGEGCSPDDWTQLIPDSWLQTTCNRCGINVRRASGTLTSYAHARLGVIGDNSGSCNDPNSWLAVGGFSGSDNNCTNNNVPQPDMTVGNRSCRGTIKSIPSFALVFVRGS